MLEGELLRSYAEGAPDDEMVDAAGVVASRRTRSWPRRSSGWSLVDYEQRKERADLALLSAGITFNVYSEDEGTERIFPFSLIPRIVDAEEWRGVDAGLKQRLQALNLFLGDLYGEQRILKEKVVPEEIVLSSPGFRPEMAGFEPPLGVYAHIAGCDLVRAESGEFVVLEDNLRTPSGVSYVLENRTVMLRVVPDLFPRWGVQAVTDYPNQLLWRRCSPWLPRRAMAPRAVLLTPGIYNSAYFEHSFLSKQMGIPLVEGSDLTVGDDDCVYLRSTTGLERVDVVYRRIDDDFLDPLVYREDSIAGGAGADAGLPGRERDAGERARGGRGGRQGGLPLGTRDHPLLPGGGADPAERGDVLRAHPVGAGLHQGSRAGAGVEAGERVGRVRRAHRRAGDG